MNRGNQRPALPCDLFRMTVGIGSEKLPLANEIGQFSSVFCAEVCLTFYPAGERHCWGRELEFGELPRIGGERTGKAGCRKEVKVRW